MKKIKEKKYFNREYIPVIFAVIILIVLIGALVFVITYKKSSSESEESSSTSNLSTSEISVSTSNTACSSETSNNVFNDAKSISMNYVVTNDTIMGYGIEYDNDINGDGVISSNDEVIPLYQTGLRVTITGITGNIYLVLTNDIDDVVQTYHNADATDGKVTFDVLDILDFRTYTVQVYSDNSECSGTLYRQFKFTLPRYNESSTSMKCVDMKAAGKANAYCDDVTYVSVDDEDNMVDSLKEDYANFIAEEEAKEEEKDTGIVAQTTNFVKDNTLYVIIGGVVLVVIIITIVIVIIKKRRNKNEK
ncbi:MAG TPA: hypothetical protein PKG93_00235 [Bacilli bacterium]|nr:hypothetical protein [Bacilli bacterium]